MKALFALPFAMLFAMASTITSPVYGDETTSRTVIIAAKGSKNAGQLFGDLFLKYLPPPVAGTPPICTPVTVAIGNEKDDDEVNEHTVFRCEIEEATASFSAVFNAYGKALLEASLVHQRLRVLATTCPGTCQYKDCGGDYVCWTKGMRCVSKCTK